MLHAATQDGAASGLSAGRLFAFLGIAVIAAFLGMSLAYGAISTAGRFLQVDVAEITGRFSDRTGTSNPVAPLLLAIGVAVPAAVWMAVAVRFYRRGFQTFVAVERPTSLRLSLCGAAACVLAFPLLGLEALLTPSKWPVSESSTSAWLYVVTLVLATPIIALAEEVVFRGWLQQQLRAFRLRPAIAITIGAGLFASFHGDFAPYPFTCRFAFGLAMGFATLRLRGVEFAIGAHALHNLLLGAFVTLPGAVSNNLVLPDVLRYLAFTFALTGLAELAARREAAFKSKAAG